MGRCIRIFSQAKLVVLQYGLGSIGRPAVHKLSFMKTRGKRWINNDFWNRSRLFQFFISTVLVGIAFAMRTILAPELGIAIPYAFFVTASILSACFGGWKPGVYSMVLGFLIADWFFIPPTGSFGGHGKIQIIALVSNFLPNSVAIVGFELLHRTRIALALSEAHLNTAKTEIEAVNTHLESAVKHRTLELQSSLHFMERFCYSIAHDLRAPLRAIRGMAAALEEDCHEKLGSTELEYTKRMSEAAAKMDQLITDLLDYGRLSHQELIVRDIVIGDVVHAVLSGLGDELNQIKAEVQWENLERSVKADRNLLEDVIRRLVSNSIKFRKLDTPLRLSISSEETSTGIRVAIRDNGLGIAGDHLKKIFGMFETLLPPTGVATGAGLTLASKAVERMRGSVGVTSKPGEGSTFWFELPAAFPEPHLRSSIEIDSGRSNARRVNRWKNPKPVP